mgnify:CR=1 FL=1
MAKTTKKAKVAVKVNLGGLPPAKIYTKTGKIARAVHNAERHELYNGKTVHEILSIKPTVMTPADIKYDVKVGFITLEDSPAYKAGFKCK